MINEHDIFTLITIVLFSLIAFRSGRSWEESKNSKINQMNNELKSAGVWRRESEGKPKVANTYYCRWVAFPLSKLVCVFRKGVFDVNAPGEIEWLDESAQEGKWTDWDIQAMSKETVQPAQDKLLEAMPPEFPPLVAAKAELAKPSEGRSAVNDELKRIWGKHDVGDELSEFDINYINEYYSKQASYWKSKTPKQ